MPTLETTSSVLDAAMKYGPYIAIGVVALIAIIVIPLVLRRARKGQSDAAVFQKGPGAKTGFAAVSVNRWEGRFQGYPAVIEAHFDFNFAGAAFSLMRGKGIGQTAESLGRQMFFHRFVFEMKTNGASLPPVAFYERDWWGVFGNVEWQRRKPLGEKVQSGVPGVDRRIDIYSTDAAFAAALASDTEFAAQLEHWPYLNLQLIGDEITLELIHHWNELAGKLGSDALMSWDFAVQALNLLAAAARAGSRALKR
ncbi:MAG: hypothetical protein HYY84_14980 [Deltaproteobacteria bacterium]|nr:hypothetical protein [Deltaproteobacteria bacterium]